MQQQIVRKTRQSACGVKKLRVVFNYFKASPQAIKVIFCLLLFIVGTKKGLHHYFFVPYPKVGLSYYFERQERMWSTQQVWGAYLTNRPFLFYENRQQKNKKYENSPKIRASRLFDLMQLLSYIRSLNHFLKRQLDLAFLRTFKNSEEI